MTSKVRNYQLNTLMSMLPYSLERNDEGEVTSITFHPSEAVNNQHSIKVTFVDYFITGFDGFDFHDKWNNGIAPFEKVMCGTIEKETAKMYYFKLNNLSYTKQWEGWCPKKCCTIEEE